MAFTDSEITRIRYELGYNTLDSGAEPYISVVALFEQVIQQYVRTATATTSTTAVVAATTPTPATLTLGSLGSIVAGDRVVIDVDQRQEIATVQAIAGATITVLLTKAHAGTYPVGLESGETIARDILRKLDIVSSKLGSTAVSAAGLQQVDEIIFDTGNGTAGSVLARLRDARMYWRDELAGALGVTNAWRIKESTTGGYGATVEVY